MINNIAGLSPVPDVAAIPAAPDVPPEVIASAAAGTTKNQSQNSDLSQGKDQQPTPEYMLRLTIDKDPKTGGWVYRAIDPTTGEVVSELPRESLLEMRKSDSYHAGSVINTEA